MRFPELVHFVITKFAPMSDADSVELQTKSNQEYFKVVKENDKYDEIKAENLRLETLAATENITETEFSQYMEQVKLLPPQNMMHKIIRYADKWYMQYLFAAISIWAVKTIQDALNPQPLDKGEFDED